MKDNLSETAWELHQNVMTRGSLLFFRSKVLCIFMPFCLHVGTVSWVFYSSFTHEYSSHSVIWISEKDSSNKTLVSKKRPVFVLSWRELQMHALNRRVSISHISTLTILAEFILAIIYVFLLLISSMISCFSFLRAECKLASSHNPN